MDTDSSDDDIQIIIPPPPSLNSHLNKNKESYSNGFGLNGGLSSTTSTTIGKGKSEVLVLSDTDTEEEEEEDDDELEVELPIVGKKSVISRSISNPTNSTLLKTTTSSDDSNEGLPDFRISNLNGNGRSRSDTGARTSTTGASGSGSTGGGAGESKFRPSGLSTSTSNIPLLPRDDYLDPDERPSTFTAKDKGKAKQRAVSPPPPLANNRREIIILDSSPPPSSPRRTNKTATGASYREYAMELDSDDDGEEDVQISKKRSRPSLDESSNSKGKKKRIDRTNDPLNEDFWNEGNNVGDEDEQEEEDEEGIRAKKSKPSPAKTKSKTTTKSKSTSLSPSKQLRASASLTSKQSKELIKIQKLKDSEFKKQITTLNILKRDRKLTVGDLIVRCSGACFDSASGDNELVGEDGTTNKSKKKSTSKPSPFISITAILSTKLTTPTSEKQVPCKILIPEFPIPNLELNNLAKEGTIRWTRICDRIWNVKNGRFEPLDENIEVEEDSRVVFITATTLLTHMTSSDPSTNLLSYIQALKSSLPSHINLFLMIYGLQAHFTKLKNSQAAIYRDRIRDELVGGDGGGGGEGSKGKGKEKEKDAGEWGREEIELELMRVQMATKIFLIHVEREEEAATWLEQLTLDVGFKPYQRQKMSSILSLGTSNSTIITGKTSTEIYINFLASLKGITDHLAKGIVKEYPTIRLLYKGWEECKGEKERREMLVGIWKNNNKNGTVSNRALGSKLSSFIYEVFTGDNPSVLLHA